MTTQTLIKIRVSRTIANEFAVRCVYGEGYEGGSLPEDFDHGDVRVTRELAISLLEDAAFQVDRDGPFGNQSSREDLPIRNAYTAFVKQLKRALAAHGREELLTECRALLAIGDRIAAIKQYRTATRASLQEAKSALGL